MIEALVKFDGDAMYVNDWVIYNIGDEWEIEKNEVYEQFVYREDAVKYCLEH